MPKLIDLKGKKFNRLTVLRRDASRTDAVFWKCLCQCGNNTSTRGYDIKHGKVKSCGCLQRDVIITRSTKHGHGKRGIHRTPTYNCWANMVNRCRNPRNTHYWFYGGRGISVCNRWLSFSAFLEDMGEKPEGMSIERINVDGNYTKSNCKWIPFKDQVNNRTDTLRVDLDGVTMPSTHAANKLGVPWRTFIRRVHEFGPSRAVILARNKIPYRLIPAFAKEQGWM